MLKYLENTFGEPDVEMDGVQAGTYGDGFFTEVDGRKGIYVVIAAKPGPSIYGGFGASGHVDLYNGTHCLTGCKFPVRGGIKGVYFWELPE